MKKVEKSVIWGFVAKEEINLNKPIKVYVTLTDDKIVVKCYKDGKRVKEETYPFMSYTLLEDILNKTVGEPFIVVQDTLLLLERESVLDNYPM